MAVASYVSDLTTLTACDVAGGVTNWTAVVSTQASLASEVDYYFQGDACISRAGFSISTPKGMIFNGTTRTIPSPGAFFIWVFFGAPNGIDTLANGGMRVIIGNSATVYKHWYVMGRIEYAYGGWVCIPVDPTVATDTTTGSPTSVTTYFGALISNTAAISKGSPMGVDSLRFGRGQITVTAGDLANGYATFAGAATVNDATSARWGLLQAINGGYQQMGLFLMGSASTAVDFEDSNVSITIANTTKVAAGFNVFEVRNASSIISWTNINISALGTVSRGDFIVTNNATITLNTCVFNRMGTFTFQSNSSITSCTFRSCNLVTRGNATISNCVFETTNDSVKALLLRDPTRSLTGCTFIAPTSGNTKHAIEITEIGTYTFTDNTFTGYTTSNGSVGTEVIYNNSGGLVTIQNSGTDGVISYMNQGSSTTSVVGSASITITVKDESDIDINGAYVYIVDSGSVEVMNATTSSGRATGSYSGSYPSGTLRVRYYGYKPYTGTVPLTSALDQTIVLITDPVQDASPPFLSSEFTINTTAKTVTHSSGTSVYTVKQFFKWLANTFAAPSYMDDTFPMMADTDTVFRFTNSWTFGALTTDYKYLNGGAITSSDSTKVWSNIYTIGSLVSGTTLDVYQNDVQLTPWWSSGHINILVLVKDTTVIDASNITVLARLYSTLYDYSIVNAPSGRNPVPLAVFADINNETAETGTFDTTPYTTITFSFGAKSRDLGTGFKPYDVEIDCKSQTIAHIYEYLKYVTRTGSSTTLNGVNGEYYTGVGDIRFTYSGASGGSGYFTQTSAITDTTTSATGYIVSEIHSGTTGTLVIRNTHGTFANTNAISSGGVTATISSVPSVIEKSKQAPFGTFAGGQFFGARGVFLKDVAGADANNYELIDSTGTTQTPPRTVATTITVQDLATGLDIEGANVLLWVTDNANYFYQAPVSITGSGTTATVSHTAHGLTTGDHVIIKGVTNDDDYNGVFQITYSNDNQYTYTATETLDASPATGASITSTFAIINGATNSGGVISDSRSLTASQPVAGWARKSFSDPYYYQQGTISGTIDSNSGLSITLQLARDE